MDFLEMSKAEVQAWAQTSQSTAADKITIETAVVRTDQRGAKRILVLKRAAHEVYYPGVFEIPGGKVDDTDLSTREAITREVKEETDLTIADVLMEEDGHDFTVNPSEHSEGLWVNSEELDLVKMANEILHVSFTRSTCYQSKVAQRPMLG
ncbi:NTP pyrophosphohydrolase [Fusarium heterosporum]|uniref:NTP pyrophosphohydrolase n=1 Tax=Fusarium heterosporum TaxID=42747 RepID=A0A8H5T379_FUSHE|nr:NTP pyrophosphohydrolase [Fusarium heterosporum]